MTKEELKQEFDDLYDSYKVDLEILLSMNSSANKQERYDKLFDSLGISLVKKSNEYGLINDKNIEEYISQLCMSFKQIYLDFQSR